MGGDRRRREEEEEEEQEEEQQHSGMAGLSWVVHACSAARTRAARADPSQATRVHPPAGRSGWSGPLQPGWEAPGGRGRSAVQQASKQGTISHGRHSRGRAQHNRRCPGFLP